MVYLTKVSLYINAELWVKFKEAVLRKHGTLRKLSSEVESFLQASLIDEDVQLVFEKMGINARSFSPEKVKQYRPKLRGPPSEVLIRDMRGRHIAESLPRQQRDG